MRQAEQLGRQLDQPGQRREQRRVGVVAQEVDLVVEDELAAQCVAAALRFAGVLGLALGDGEMRAEAVVQGGNAAAMPTGRRRKSAGLSPRRGPCVAAAAVSRSA